MPLCPINLFCILWCHLEHHRIAKSGILERSRTCGKLGEPARHIRLVGPDGKRLSLVKNCRTLRYFRSKFIVRTMIQKRLEADPRPRVRDRWCVVQCAPGKTDQRRDGPQTRTPSPPPASRASSPARCQEPNGADQCRIPNTEPRRSCCRYDSTTNYRLRSSLFIIFSTA